MSRSRKASAHWTQPLTRKGSMPNNIFSHRNVHEMHDVYREGDVRAWGRMYFQDNRFSDFVPNKMKCKTQYNKKRKAYERVCKEVKNRDYRGRMYSGPGEGHYKWGTFWTSP